MELSSTVLLDGLTWFLVFVVSTSLHEAAHAWVALLGGDPTASRGGQVSLSPIPHMRREPIGMILVPLLSFAANGGRWMMGWASAPYDPLWAARHPRRAAVMSLAGPVANLLLAAFAFAALRIGLAAGWFAVPGSASFSHVVDGQGWANGAGTLLSILLMLNVILGLFNLLPVPPLDGHAVVPLFLTDEGGHRWREGMRRFGIMGLVLAWFLFGKIFGPVFTFVLGLLHPGTTWG